MKAFFESVLADDKQRHSDEVRRIKSSIGS